MNEQWRLNNDYPYSNYSKYGDVYRRKDNVLVGNNSHGYSISFECCDGGLFDWGDPYWDEVVDSYTRRAWVDEVEETAQEAMDIADKVCPLGCGHV